ncbi:MAG: hypothetical protein RL555_733 [Bacteroidota bacterium]|jgi:ubiquinone/menaquinone biosynthesis C-methylase UbiE
MSNEKYIPALKYNWLTGIYDWLIRTFMPEKKFKGAVIENANIQNGYAVLDFGVGTATLSIMASQANPNAVYKGIDIDEKILRIARKKIEAANAPVELIKYNGGKLPFADGSFDRVISSLVIHHLTTEQKQEAFQEFKRILKPGGEVHIADWGKESNFLMRLMFHFVQLLDGYKTTNDNVKGRLPEIIRGAGFNTVNIVKHFNTTLGTVEIFRLRPQALTVIDKE